MPTWVLSLLKWFETPTGQRVLIWLGRPIIAELKKQVQKAYQAIKNKLATKKYEQVIDSPEREKKREDIEKFVNS